MFKRFLVGALVVGALAALGGPAAAATSPEPGTPAVCTVAGAMEGSFPAWNVATPIDRYATAPDGTIVFAARGLLWRWTAGTLTVVAGGGGVRPDTATGPIPTSDLRWDFPEGLDVAPDGTIWATDNRTLFRIADDIVTPVWTPAPTLAVNGALQATELKVVHATTAGVYVVTDQAVSGSSYLRVVKVGPGDSTVVVGGGGWTLPDDVPEGGISATSVEITDADGVAVDSAGGLYVLNSRTVLVPGGSGKLVKAPALTNPSNTIALTAGGTLLASDYLGPLKLQGGSWSRLPGPELTRMDTMSDGSLVDLLGSRESLRRISATGVVTSLTGWDAARPGFTNAGRTTATSFFGPISALQADGRDVLLAEAVPTARSEEYGTELRSRIVRVRSDGTVVPVAGNASWSSLDEVITYPSGPATGTPLGNVREIDVDADGNVLFLSPQFGIGRIDQSGTLTQVVRPASTASVDYMVGFESLGAGRYVYGTRDGTLWLRRADGTRQTLSRSGFVASDSLPLGQLMLQFVEDIETDRDGKLVVQGDYSVWRLDLSNNTARRIVSTKTTEISALTRTQVSGLAVDSVGNIAIAGHARGAVPGMTTSDLWRIGPGDALTPLGRVVDSNPEVNGGDPRAFGQAGGVTFDDAGNLLVSDGESGRIIRDGSCVPEKVGLHLIDTSRLLDTRNGTGIPTTARPASSQTIEVQITGRGGIPDGATAVTLNVAVTQPTASSHLTVWPCGTRPTVSNLNFAKGQTVANQVNVRLSERGTVCMQSPASTHVVADVQGWFGQAGSELAPLDPTRLLDTRTLGGRIPARTEVRVPIAGRGGVPGSGAVAAALNVAITQPSSAGWLVAYPCGTPVPLASSVNFNSGQTIPNAVLARLGVDGAVCLYSSAPTHVVVDLVGSWQATGSSVSFVKPERTVDTRVAWGAGAPRRLRAGQVSRFVPTRALGVPSDATAVIVNTAAVSPAKGGHVTFWPCSGTVPTASTLNFVSGAVSANAAVVRMDDDGAFCARSTVDVDLVVDVAGYASP